MDEQQRGQSILEYAILIAVVIAALTAMQVYAKRGIQAGIKTAADQIGTQEDGMRYESGERRNRAVAAAGDVLDRQSATTADSSRAITQSQAAGGGVSRAINEQTSTTGALAGGASSYSRVVVEPDE